MPVETIYKATEPEVVVEDGYTRTGFVRDASEDCVRGDVIKPPAKASKLLVVARRQHLQLSFSNNTASESSSKHRQSWLMSVKDVAQTAFVTEIRADTQHKPPDPRMLQSIVTLSLSAERHTSSALSQHQPLLLMLQPHPGVSSWHGGLVRGGRPLHRGLSQGLDD